MGLFKAKMASLADKLYDTTVRQEKVEPEKVTKKSSKNKVARKKK